MSKESPEQRHKKLRKIMTDNNMTSLDVARVTLYKPATVRAFMCGARAVPPRAIRLLENGLALK